MINLYKSDKPGHWSIITGIILLIVAFIIMIFSNNDASSKNIRQTSAHTEAITTSKVVETTSEPPEEITTVSPSKSAYDKAKRLKKKIDFKADHPFTIRVNKKKNFAVVYGISKNKKHYIPYKAFVCSTGLNDRYTPLGTFTMSDKYLWHLMVDGTYGRYAIRINGHIMLHSIPYVHQSNDSMEYWEYNKLGKPASLGCVRFRLKDIKWIYEHCPVGTTVTIYNAPREKCPLPLPDIKKIRDKGSKTGWDPTDSDKDNPWKSKKKEKKRKKNKNKHKDY